MPSKKPQNKDAAVKVAIIGAMATVIVAIISTTPLWLEYTTRLSPRQTDVSPSLLDDNPRLVFRDTFDIAQKGWDNGEYVETYAVVTLSIKDGKLFRTTQTTPTTYGYWGTTEIPMVSLKNLCLIFEARASEYSGDFALLVSLRANNYGQSEISSHYRVQLSDNGHGAIFIKTPGEGTTRQISEFENGILWSDKNIHQVKISLQDDLLEIYDGQTNTLLHKLKFTSDDLLSNIGEIRLGSEIFSPNQQIVTTEYDNVFVYSQCL